MNTFSFRFKKNNRIKKSIEIYGVLKNGKFIKDKYYTCRYIENGLDDKRLGIIVKKKLINAVKRNYEKRILREFFRLTKNTISNNFDILITVTDSTGTFAEKKNAFERIISKIH